MPTEILYGQDEDGDYRCWRWPQVWLPAQSLPAVLCIGGRSWAISAILLQTAKIKNADRQAWLTQTLERTRGASRN
ncbi:MAG: hypothetical protein EOS23_30865 [Mesorhizobium sp.]|nr:MAG: hypothetical protein EOS23_30865 [Mesorhizobium sp.]TIU10296.1 MAG: hypothetical protein E5W39_00855 [Mesorhizobium sp.]TIV85365.1 MAG: hypothetical protein E5V64_00635 [Mesorhizobium sp.]